VGSEDNRRRRTLSVRIVIAAALTITSLAAVDGLAQTPRERPALGDGPWTFDTYEPQTPIRVNVIAKGLSHPFSVAFLPDGDLLVTERPGRLRIVRDGVLDPGRPSWAVIGKAIRSSSRPRTSTALPA
jgi:glucose/arabinose dehydrogenase